MSGEERPDGGPVDPRPPDPLDGRPEVVLVAGSGAAALAEAQADEQLAAHLEWSEGPTVSFVFADDADVVQRLRESAFARVAAAGGRARWVHPITPQALREVVRELLTTRRRYELVWLEALGEGRIWSDAWNDVLVRLNERRERLRRDLAGSLVVVAPVRAKARFREAAPDLWSIRSLALELRPRDPEPADPPLDRRAARTNAYRIAEALLRVQFHRRMRQRPWYALVISEDPSVRRRMLDALVDRGLAVLVHASPSPALTLPTEADLHWVHVEDDPRVTLLATLAGEGPPLSRPMLIEGTPRLALGLERHLPELFAHVAFTVRLYPERRIHPGPLPVLDRAEGLVRDVWDALDRARTLERELRRGRKGDGKMRAERVRELQRAAEALVAQGWSSEAQPLIGELLEAVEALRPTDPEASRLYAEAQEIAGRVASMRSDHPEALARYSAALPVRRRLARSRGSERLRRRSELARCLSTLGELQVGLRQMDAADAALREALAIRRRLARQSDDRETLSELGMSWSLLGDLLLARHEVGDGQIKAALEAYQHALWIRERVAADEDSPRFRRFLSVAHGRMGRLYARSDDWDNARRAYERAAEIAFALVRDDPTNPSLRSEASVTASHLADALRAHGDLAGAYAAYREAVEQRRRLLAEDPDSARNQEILAVACGRLAEVAAELDDLEEGLRASLRAVELSDHLVWMDPSSLKWRRGLATAHLRHGDLLKRAEHPVEARDAWLRALEVADQLLDSGTHEGRRLARDVLAQLEARGLGPDELDTVRRRSEPG